MTKRDKALTVDASVGPVGAAPLLRRAVALYVYDVQTVHVQCLALQRDVGVGGRDKKREKKHGVSQFSCGLKHVTAFGATERAIFHVQTATVLSLHPLLFQVSS